MGAINHLSRSYMVPPNLLRGNPPSVLSMQKLGEGEMPLCSQKEKWNENTLFHSFVSTAEKKAFMQHRIEKLDKTPFSLSMFRLWCHTSLHYRVYSFFDLRRERESGFSFRKQENSLSPVSFFSHTDSSCGSQKKKKNEWIGANRRSREGFYSIILNRKYERKAAWRK